MHNQFESIEKESAVFTDKHEPDVHGGYSNLSNPADTTVKLPQEYKRVEETTGKQSRIKNEKMGGKFGRQGEKYKIAAMAVLLAGACFLTYYFHVVLNRGTLLTHLFYIPIGLAAFWWKRKGVFVAIFLGTMLLLSHKFLRADVVIPFHDYFRAIMLLITGFVVAMLSEELSKTKALNKRVKELSCLCDLSKLAEQGDIALDVILQEVVSLMQNSWRYPDIIYVRAVVDDKEFKTENFKETRWKQSVDIKANGRKAGTFEVYYLKQRRQVHEGPFLKEERDLIEAVAEHLGMIIHRKEADEALQKSESDKDMILNNLSELIVYQDRNLKIVWANKAAVDSVGQSVDQLTGRHCYEVWFQRDEPCPDCPVQKSFETGRPQESDVPMPDGKIWHIRSYPVRDQNGDVTGAVDVVLDITQRKRVEENLRDERDRLKTLFDGLGRVAIGIDVVGVDYKIRLQNPLLQERFGDCTGKLCYESYMGLKEPCDFCPMIKAVRNNKPESVELTAKDGRDYELLSAPLPNPDGMIDKVIGVIRDITRFKQAEEQARQIRTELERISRIITVGEMASGLAHELNQPLCAIANYANGCLRMMKTETTNSGKLLSAIEQIAAQADRGGKIIHRIRSLIGRREPHLSTVDINKIVRDVVSLEEAAVTQAGVAIQLELDGDIPLILADKIEIEQVVLNLAKNGVEAMSDTAIDRRQLTIRTSAVGSDAVQVAVRDMGKGLPLEEADKIFDSFFSTKPAGLGMGLSISRSIIEGHRGKLWGEPNPDAGTTFRFILPLKRKENG